MKRVLPSYEERISGCLVPVRPYGMTRPSLGCMSSIAFRTGAGGLRVPAARRPGVRLRDRQPVDRRSAVIVGPWVVQISL